MPGDDVIAKFGADTRDLDRAADKMDDMFDEGKKGAESWGKSWQYAGTWAVDKATDVGVALAGAAQEGIYSMAQIEQLTTRIEALGGVSAEQVQMISSLAKRLAVETGTAVEDVLMVGEEMLSSGWGDLADEIIEAGNNIYIAGGGFAEFGDSVGGVSSIMKNLQGDFQDAGDAADWIKKVYDKGKITIGELADAMGNVAPKASAAGLTLDEVGAAIATITAKTGDAEGISRRFGTMLVSIAKNWDQAVGKLATKDKAGTGLLGMGVSPDVIASTQSFSEKLALIAENSNMIDVDWYAKLVGGENLDMFYALVEAQSVYADNLMEVADRQGAAKKGAEEFNKKLDQQLKIMEQQRDAGKRMLGEFFLPLQQVMWAGEGGAIGAFMGLNDALESTFTSMFEFADKAGPVIDRLIGIKNAIAPLRQYMPGGSKWFSTIYSGAGSLYGKRRAAGDVSQSQAAIGVWQQRIAEGSTQTVGLGEQNLSALKTATNVLSNVPGMRKELSEVETRLANIETQFSTIPLTGK